MIKKKLNCLIIKIVKRILIYLAILNLTDKKGSIIQISCKKI